MHNHSCHVDSTACNINEMLSQVKMPNTEQWKTNDSNSDACSYSTVKTHWKMSIPEERLTYNLDR